MEREGRPEEELLDPQQAVGCAVSCLEDAKERESPTGLKVMAGHFQAVLQLVHPLSDHSALARMGQALRREFPKQGGVRDTIWDLDVLLAHVQAAYKDNGALSRKQLMDKTMLLIMVFGMSRPAEIARMEMPQPGDIGREEACLRTIPKQRGTVRTPVVIRKASIAALCPLAALTAWLEVRQNDPSPCLFTEGRRERAAAPGESPERARQTNAFAPASTSTRAADLSTAYIRRAFRAIMDDAGIPQRYKPYTIRHATVTALFMRGASDEQVAAFGRWARDSRVPRLFYYIHATDGAWIGKTLLAEQPALETEFLHLRGQGGSGAEAEDGQSATGSSAASEAERGESAASQ
jgi:hypothetical protein